MCKDTFYAERLALIRQQRLEAAKKREEEKAGMLSLSLSLACLLAHSWLASFNIVRHFVMLPRGE
jgi:hypothetical protein